MAKKHAGAAAPCLLIYMSLLAALVLILGVVLVSGDPITSCSQTPYPQVCYSSLNSTSSTTGSTPPVINVAQDGTYKPAGFVQLNLQACRDRAQQVQQLASSSSYYDHMMRGSLDARARAAWDDCLELSQVTLDHLNRLTGSAAGTTSADDVQTWLSAAMANQETCRNGFVDFDLSHQLLPSLPFTTNNVSQLLSNSLAIFSSSTTGSSDNPKPLQPGGAGGRRLLSAGGNYFPTWVSAADRRLLQSSTVKANLVVAKDGSGNYKTISEAVAASAKLRSGSTGRFVIYVKAGVYSENVEVTKSMTNVMLVGDGIDRTVVTGSRNVQDGSTTFRSATFAAVGNGFIARDMTFQNTAGPQKHQAVARCRPPVRVRPLRLLPLQLQGLSRHPLRAFPAPVLPRVRHLWHRRLYLWRCCCRSAKLQHLHQAAHEQPENTVTAQGRTDPNENTGISIHNSKVTAASDLKPVQGSFKSYLGRPWQQYSRTVFMQSNLDGLIDPAGWLEWSGNFALSTLYYGEYGNTGAGADTSKRVKWGGYRVITSATEAAKFTVGNFLSGNSWIPATGVPFNAGLL